MNGQLEAHLFYLQGAAWAAERSLTGVHDFLVAQAADELVHMHLLFKYLTEIGAKVTFASVPQPVIAANGVKGVFEAVRDLELRVTKSVGETYAQARAENDHATESFLKQFVDGQHAREHAVPLRAGPHRARSGNGPEALYLIDRELTALGCRRCGDSRLSRCGAGDRRRDEGGRHAARGSLRAGLHGTGDIRRDGLRARTSPLDRPTRSWSARSTTRPAPPRRGGLSLGEDIDQAHVKFAKAKKQIEDETGITFSMEGSAMSQWGVPNGGFGAVQGMFSPAVNWSAFNNEKIGAGSFQFHFLRRNTGRATTCTTVGANLDLVSPINNQPTANNQFVQLTYTHSIGDWLSISAGFSTPSPISTVMPTPTTSR